MKHHYRYYQRDEKSPWIAVHDDEAEREARAQGAVRLTPLCTNKQLGNFEGTDLPRDVRFFGPFYADIDNKGDLQAAIDSGVRFVDRLIGDYGVAERDIQVFLSGSKGVHIFVPPSAFGLERSVARLPQIFKEMAKVLYVPGLDLQPYSLRNAFRLVNVQRSDGAYRVPVSVAELRELDPEGYRDLCSKPRLDYDHPRPSGVSYPPLIALFEAAAEAAKKAARPNVEPSTVLPAVLRDKFKDELPPCMVALGDGKVDTSKNFNEVAFQAAVFAARLSPDGYGVFDPVFDRMADNIESSQYSTPRLRREHLDGCYHYVRNSSYQFSCNAMRSVLKHRVCADCVLQAAEVVETPEDAARVVGLGVRADGYFDETSKTPRRISTFVVEPEHVYSEIMDDGSVRRVGTVANVKTNGTSVGRVFLEEEAWTNRQAFLRSLKGLGNLSFLGGDADLQKIKFVTMSEPDLPEKIRVTTMGMHISTINDREVRTYVERDRSINSVRMPDTHNFDGIPQYEPFLLKGNHNQVPDEVATEALKLLLQMNDIKVVGTMVGWVTATHLKAHLHYLYRQFPPLNAWGNQSSGKTTTARIVCVLGGVDFIRDHEEMNVPSSTPFAWLDSLSNCSSVPVLWDELNRTAKRMTAEGYAKACEMLKATWDGSGANKGTIRSHSNGVGIRTYKMVRPAIYCSEQPPTNLALVDRSVSVLFTRQGMKGKRDIHQQLRERIAGLRKLAYVLLVAALKTPTSDVAAMFKAADKEMPEMKERPRYGLAVCLMGLYWLKKVCADAEMLDDELAGLLDKAADAVKTRAAAVKESQDHEEMVSEVDRAMGEMFEILDLAVQVDKGLANVNPPLRAGIHFQIVNRAGRSLLYIDVRSAHSAYLRHARAKGVDVVLDQLKDFMILARVEEYVDSFVQDTAILGGRFAMVVDLKKAKKRGLPVEMLGENAYEEF